MRSLHHPLFLLLGLAATAAAQTPRYTFSIEWHGPTVGLLDPQTGVAITEGDILAPSTGPYPFAGPPRLGPVFTPTVVVNHLTPGLGLAPGCVGHVAGTPCWVEVDAFSRGADAPVTGQGIRPGGVFFSVDEFALGVPGGIPDAFTEAAPGDASADSFVTPAFMPPGPLPPGAAPFGNVGTVDGDGYAFVSGMTYPGSGLIEPNPPAPGPATPGDDLDALDVVDASSGFPLTLFSLDSAFVDPLTGVPGAGSAAFHGVSGGDVLLAIPGGPPAVWAPARLLGLDIQGPDTDDLDALAVWDNGNGTFQVSQLPNDWTSGGHDMVLFSVRRGSAVVGMPDSIFGLPILPGDILTAPLAGSPISPFPGIYIAAENLNLFAIRFGPLFQGDDLNALDLVGAALLDCNNNGIEDSIDILSGVATDANGNGVPDICETGVGTAYCYCTLPVSPCGNAFPAGGCLNASGTGAILTGAGSTSVSADNLLLSTTGMNPFGFALTFYGTVPVPPVPVHNGILCANGVNWRLPPYSTLAGTASIGPGIAALSVFYYPPAGHITAGTTWQFQTWYRDVGGPCGSFSNFSNALSIQFTP